MEKSNTTLIGKGRSKSIAGKKVNNITFGDSTSESKRSVSRPISRYKKSTILMPNNFKNKKVSFTK